MLFRSTRDYETGQKRYDDLLAKNNDAKMQSDLEHGQQGEQMSLLNAASFPDKPSFPNRLLFAEGGLGTGLAFGLGLALWVELRDKAIRSEEDIVAILDPPLLVSIPWVAGDEKSSKELRAGST